MTLNLNRLYLGLAITVALLCSPAYASTAFCAVAKVPTNKTLLSAAARAPAPQPQAIAVLHTEGTLPHQGIYDISNAARRDFAYMRDLALAWRYAHDTNALTRLSEYVDAWLSTYQLSFNPIDETNLEGLIDAYRLTENDLPPAIRERARTFLFALARGYLQRMDQHQQDKRHTWSNNWQSHRIKLVTLSAVALGDLPLLAAAQQAFVRQLNANMHADGEVIDFAERDALHYVVYDLEPLVRAALAARTKGQHWLDLGGKEGQSLRKALEWLKPYAEGTKTHDEFANTKVRFDIERRQAGVSGFAGQWQPKTAATLYWSASLLAADYLETAQRLNHAPPRWIWAVADCP